jgi:hypothetical protein
MANKKKTAPQQPSGKESEPTQTPNLPPPDDPLLRSTEFDAERAYDSREMARKRLEAIIQTQKMPSDEEESPPTAQEQTGAPKPSGSEGTA